MNIKDHPVACNLINLYGLQKKKNNKINFWDYLLQERIQFSEKVRIS